VVAALILVVVQDGVVISVPCSRWWSGVTNQQIQCAIREALSSRCRGSSGSVDGSNGAVI
jgi:hypothetical protein